MDFLNSLDTLIKNNTILASLIGLSGAGMITFWVKDVPRNIYSILKREFTTELTIASNHRSFHKVMRYIESNYSSKNFRRFNVTNGRWGYDDEAIVSMGYGVHIIKYKNTFMLFNMIKETANQTSEDKIILIISKIGRSRKLLDSFVKDALCTIEDNGNIKLYKMTDCWNFAKEQIKRKIETVFIEEYKKTSLITTLNNFINGEEWYLNHGVPYQLGILFYGPPGTGKTSLIKAVASYINYPIYYLSPQSLCKIDSAMATLPKKCVIVIEDIDSSVVTHDRSEEKNTESNMNLELITTCLSEVLNSLDGLFSSHGRILVATTNHIEKLDGALIRPGRIDLKIEVGYVTNEILNQFLKSFFPEENIDISDIKIIPKLTTSELQNMILKKYSIQEILYNCTQKGDALS